MIEVADAQHRIRLAGIDAPEKNQPWGEASTRELRRQIAGKHVVVGWHKRDRWKRLIGIVRLAGEDMNLHMIDRGLAWHYKRYADEQSRADREARNRLDCRTERETGAVVGPCAGAPVGVAEVVTLFSKADGRAAVGYRRNRP